MKYFAITTDGAECFFLKELENFGIKGEIFKQIVMFETEEINKVLYHSLTVKKICEFVSKGKISSPKIDLEKKEESFGVRLKHPSDEKFDRKKIESEFGSLINRQTEMKVDLKKPDYWFSLFVTGKDYFLGIDLTHQELDKRTYRVFNNPQSLKGSLAASALFFAGYNGNQVLLDAFCRGGEIAIEAGIISSGISPWKYEPLELENPNLLTKNPKKSIYCFDELIGNITASKKNAKLAGVDKFLTFSKVEVGWLDTRLDENSVDLIVTQPPIPSKLNKKADKSIEEFFYQAEFILNAGGKIVFITINDEETFKIATKYKFEIVRKHVLKSGMQNYYLYEFGRK